MPPSTTHGFTKLVVRDVEAMSRFYSDAFGLHAVHRENRHSIGGEKIDEIMMSHDPSAKWTSLVLLQYLGRGASPNGEVILGFQTDDLPALLERIVKAGGAIRVPMRELADLGVRVAFATDPEGHLAELVQVVA